MAIGDFVVDVCSQSDPDKLSAHVEASKAYWTGPTKGYKLISDDIGHDYLRVFTSTIDQGKYATGLPKTWSAEVVLVYHRQI